jgi:hypothetical protein
LANEDGFAVYERPGKRHCLVVPFVYGSRAGAVWTKRIVSVPRIVLGAAVVPRSAV